MELALSMIFTKTRSAILSDQQRLATSHQSHQI